MQVIQPIYIMPRVLISHPSPRMTQIPLGKPLQALSQAPIGETTTMQQPHLGQYFHCQPFQQYQNNPRIWQPSMGYPNYQNNLYHLG